jgi:hypothetical protein
MYTHYSLPAGELAPVPSRRRRRLTALLVAAASAAALALSGGAAEASAATWVSVDTPYVHDGWLSGNRFIQTNAYAQGCCLPSRVESTLYQYYRGGWHQVAINDSTSAQYGNKAKAFVHCTGAYTPYWFQARARVWFKGPYGWYHADTAWSRVIQRSC